MFFNSNHAIDNQSYLYYMWMKIWEKKTFFFKTVTNKKNMRKRNMKKNHTIVKRKIFTNNNETSQ